MPWKKFCRALSQAGLPECAEPLNHEGAHIFAHCEAEELMDRCAVMLKEYRSMIDEHVASAVSAPVLGARRED